MRVLFILLSLSAVVVYLFTLFVSLVPGARDSSVLCDVTSEFGLDIVNCQGNIVKKVRIAATDLVRSIIAVSKLSTLRLQFAHLRFGKSSSSFNIISNRELILDASFSWLALLPNIVTLWWL